MGDQSVGARPDPRIGTRVGKYEIDRLVGVGGMGKVYDATADDGTRVALKILKEDLVDDGIARSRFRREAEIAATIRNRHLVSVLDSGEHAGVPYMAQRFIDGSSLASTLESHGRLDVETTVGICADVLEGLEALWDAGVVHRDVKPGNILLQRAGAACLTDFGLAKDSCGSLLTLPGQTLGSLAYMAPEQIRSEGVTAAADIYSLGCVLFECLQGQPPFGDRVGIRLLWAHLGDEPPDPTTGRGDLTAEFGEALTAALRKDPDERPVGAEYLVSLVEAAGLVADRAAR